MISFIEELSLNALPALQTVYYDGWLLRLADGYTRRANSVYTLYPSTLDLAEKLQYCETVYSRQGQAVVFKLTTACQPENLDSWLARQGYRKESPTSVQTLELANFEMPSAGEILASAELTEDWLNTFCCLNQIANENIPILGQMLGKIVPSRCFMALVENGEVIATGLAVLERGYIGLFDIVTAPAVRNRGIGRQLVINLLQWGRTQGAARAYLQVVKQNSAALHLYARLGFQESYQYWYRVKE